MAVRGDDEKAEILTYVGYARGELHGLSRADYTARATDGFAKALEAHAHLSDAPLAEKAPRVDAQKATAEGQLPLLPREGEAVRPLRLAPPRRRALRRGEAREAWHKHHSAGQVAAQDLEQGEAILLVDLGLAGGGKRWSNQLGSVPGLSRLRGFRSSKSCPSTG